MFKFFRKKTSIEEKNIKWFNTALLKLNDFISLKKWDKAERWIKEIKNKETENFQDKFEKVEEKEKKSFKKSFDNKLEKLEKLEKKLEKEKKKYEEKLYKDRINARIDKIKREIWNLKEDNIEDINLILKDLLKDYPNDEKVLKFYTKNKKKLVRFKEKIKTWDEKNEKSKKINDILWELNKEVLKWNDEKINENFFEKIKKKVLFYKAFREKIKQKKLLDEIEIIMESNLSEDNKLLEKKLSHLHSWLTKELKWVDIKWYEFYWKILWADKITWDVFDEKELKDSYRFFIWDATWHWIKAGFMVSLLTQKFNEIIKKKDLREVAFNINNVLKQDLKSWNFVTSILFEIKKDKAEKIEFIWMWHEPIFVFRKGKNEVERIVPWGLASWIRIIKDIENIKKKELFLEDWDVLFSYSDWVIEVKNKDWEMFGFQGLKNAINVACEKFSNPKDIYDFIIKTVREHNVNSSKLPDDTTLIVLKRNSKTDFINDEKELEKIAEWKWIKDKKVFKKLKWKNKQEIEKEIKILQKKEKVKSIVKALETLYNTGEILTLKAEAIRYIKDGYYDEKIKFYLKKALDQENVYKIRQKDKKMINKFHLLEELYKRWDYENVINECSEIIAKDWNI